MTNSDPQLCSPSPADRSTTCARSWSTTSRRWCRTGGPSQWWSPASTRAASSTSSTACLCPEKRGLRCGGSSAPGGRWARRRALSYCRAGGSLRHLSSLLPFFQGRRICFLIRCCSVFGSEKRVYVPAHQCHTGAAHPCPDTVHNLKQRQVLGKGLWKLLQCAEQSPIAAGPCCHFLSPARFSL